MTEWVPTRETVERALATAVGAAKIAERFGGRGLGRLLGAAPRLSLAEMRALAGECRRLGADLAVLAVYIERTIGER
ncbi:MAG TPA: hypothetical protein VM238_00050 [Phycisphaerae bacterium]|nr:hypothetical protein [Phycisphaerae bacterium]